MGFKWKKSKPTVKQEEAEAPRPTVLPALMPAIEAPILSDLPTDTVAVSCYAALAEAQSDSAAYREVVPLLRRRKHLSELVLDMDERIAPLAEDARIKSEEFEELRFEKHFEELQASDEEDPAESLADSLDHVQFIPEKRDELLVAVEALAQLEFSRARARTELKAVVTPLIATFAPLAGAQATRAVELLEAQLAEVVASENQVTSDGESLGSTNPSVFDELEDYFDSTGEAPAHTLSHSSDSVFAIDK